MKFIYEVTFYMKYLEAFWGSWMCFVLIADNELCAGEKWFQCLPSALPAGLVRGLPKSHHHTGGLFFFLV